MKLKTPIESERLYLRTLQDDDATKDYLSWLSDPLVNAYLDIRVSPPESIEQLASYIDKTNKNTHGLLLGIFLRGDDSHIGNIKLESIDWDTQICDVGFLIGDKEKWGKGYATEAIVLLVGHAFENLKIVKVTAGCAIENRSAQRGLLKAGFVEKGTRPLNIPLVNSDNMDGLLFCREKPASNQVSRASRE